MKKQITALLITIAMLLAVVPTAFGVPTTAPVTLPLGNGQGAQVQLMARESVTWVTQEDMQGPWKSPVITITGDGEYTITLETPGGFDRLSSFGLYSAGHSFDNFLTPMQNAVSPAHQWNNATMTFTKAVANGTVDISPDFLDMHSQPANGLRNTLPLIRTTANTPNESLRGFVFADLWNAWDEESQRLGNVTAVMDSSFTSNFLHFRLNATPPPVINSLEVTFTVSGTGVRKIEDTTPVTTVTTAATTPPHPEGLTYGIVASIATDTNFMIEFRITNNSNVAVGGFNTPAWRVALEIPQGRRTEDEVRLHGAISREQVVSGSGTNRIIIESQPAANQSWQPSLIEPGASVSVHVSVIRDDGIPSTGTAAVTTPAATLPTNTTAQTAVTAQTTATAVTTATNPVIASDWTYSENTDGTLTVTGYSGANMNVVIPSAINGRTVTRIGTSALSITHSPNRRITSLVIPDTVTHIGGSAFFGNEYMTSLTIGNSVQIIGAGAFQNCPRLTSVIIPDSVTEIGDRAFFTTALETITIGGNVTTIGNGALSNTRLETVRIPASVTTIGVVAFEDNMRLTTLIFDSATPPAMYESSFLNTPLLQMIQVPAGSGTAYRASPALAGRNIAELMITTTTTTVTAVITVPPTTTAVVATAVNTTATGNVEVTVPATTTVSGTTGGTVTVTSPPTTALTSVTTSAPPVTTTTQLGTNTTIPTVGQATITITYPPATTGTGVQTTVTALSTTSAPNTGVISLTTSSEALQPYFLGDVNGNGVIDCGDYLEIVKFLDRLPSALDGNPRAVAAADVRGTALITIASALEIQKFLRGELSVIYANSPKRACGSCEVCTYPEVTTTVTSATGAVTTPPTATTTAQPANNTLTPEVIQMIIASGVPAKIELTCGTVITINPQSISNPAQVINNINVNINITVSDNTNRPAIVPENSILIQPAAHGQFGLELEFTVSAEQLEEAGLNSKTAELFYVDSGNVKRENVGRIISRNSDGSVTIGISQGSYYYLAEPQPPTPALRLGAVLNGKDVTIGDALEILKHLAKLTNLSGNSLIAARITVAYNANPSINCALEVLKFLAKLESKVT
jgi:hypothetical protein